MDSNTAGRRCAMACVGMLICLGVAPAGSCLAASQAAQTIDDSAHGFSLVLPEGFAPDPAVAESSPDIIHAFVLGDPTDAEWDIRLIILDMGGTVDQTGMPASGTELPDGKRTFAMRWQGHNINAVEIPEHLNNTDFLTLNAEVPLKKGAILLKVVGPAERKQESHRLLREIVDGLKGPSNWDEDAAGGGQFAPAQQARRQISQKILIGVIVAIVLVGIFVYWMVSRLGPNWAVLVVAVCIWVVGSAVGSSQLARLVSGSLKLVGFLGILLGIVDLFRKRKGKPTPSNEAPESEPREGGG